MFKIKNVRTNEELRLTSDQFKEKIIRDTNCKFENTAVLQERTGLRPESLGSLIETLSSELIIQKHVFLVTALSRINKDKNTRYMILVEGDNYDKRLPSLFYRNVPIYSVIIEGEENQEGKLSSLSKWFRTNMGRGFSFTDIDYLLIDPTYNKVALIEEKIGKSGISAIGYGQLISYKELLTDVIINPLFLLFVFSTTNATLGTIISYYNCTKNSFIGNSLKDFETKKISLNELSKAIKKVMS